jgi:hypothetical protein
MYKSKYREYLITNPKPLQSGDLAHHKHKSKACIRREIVPHATVEVAVARTLGYVIPFCG